MTTHLHRLSGVEVARLTTTHRPIAETVTIWGLAVGSALALIAAGIAALVH